jgi:hypothetical protein
MSVQRGRALLSTLSASPVLWPYGGLTLFLALLFWPAWVEGERLIVGGDALIIHYPWWVLWRDLLAAGEPPFWNPYTFSGIPAFPTLQSGFGYPPHWAVTWLPPVRAMNWMLGLHVVLAGLGTAWCAGRLGATPSGQIVSGASFALGSALTARLWAGHVSFVETNAWLPIATGFAVQIGRRGAVVRLALVVAIMTLAGQPEVLIFGLWWLPIWAGVGATRDPDRRVFRSVVRVALGVVLGLALAAFQVLPVVELARISNRQIGMGWEFQTTTSWPPWHVLTAISPTIFGDPERTYWPGQPYDWHEKLFFVGLVTLFAAGRVRGQWRWLCWGLAATALVLSFGRYLPGYSLTNLVPGYASFRVPPKHLLLAALALALAGGIGLERMHGRGVVRVALFGTAVAAVAALSAGLWLPTVAGALADPVRLTEPIVQSGLVDTGAAGLGWAAATLLAVAGMALLPAVPARRGMAALALVELGLVLQPYHLHPTDPSLALVGADAIRGQERAVVVGSIAPVLANQGPVLRVVQPGGYVSLFSGPYQLLTEARVGPGVVIYIHSTDDPAIALLGYGVVADMAQGRVTVTEPRPPLVWVARCARPGGALEARRPDFPGSRCVTRLDLPSAEPEMPPGAAAVLDSGPGRMTVQAEGPGWLATRLPWYPGWAALVDGTPAAVELFNGALVGVRLADGPHTVALWYRPAGLDLGIVVSGVAGLVTLVMWWADRRPAHRPVLPERQVADAS